MQDMTPKSITRSPRVTIDAVSGEVMSESDIQELTLLDLYAQEVCARLGTSLPVHIAKANELLKSDGSNRLQVLKEISEFCSPDTVPLSNYFGKTIKVIGAAVIKHGPYKGMDGEWHPNGYNYIVLKLAETKEVEVIKDRKVETKKQNVLVKVSGGQPCSLFAAILEMTGWFTWPAGSELSVTVSQSNGAHCVSISE